MNLVIKLVLSVTIAIALILPYLSVNGESGALGAMESFNTLGILLIAAVFLLFVALYCRSLQKCLSLISAGSRVCHPKSVWLMFLIPYNFIEDFFIVLNISDSLKEESRHNLRLNKIKDFGTVSGLGWCIAQILSLIPGVTGQIAGIVCFVCWVIHWIWVIKINNVLQQAPVAINN